MLTTTRPRPCPFCGARLVVVRPSTAATWVACAHHPCRAIGPTRHSREAAIDAWNAAPRIGRLGRITRPPDPDEPDWLPPAA